MHSCILLVLTLPVVVVLACVMLAKLRSIQIAFFVLGLAMAVFAMVLLLFGFLSTGLTRENVCSTVTCVKGGGVSSFVVSSALFFLFRCS